MPYPGLVFQLIPEGGNHFRIVISNEKEGQVLVVNVTDYENCPESPCILDVGVHPNITKKSVVFYRRAKEFEAAKIDQSIAKGLIRKLQDCNPALLSRIIEGARVADDLTFRFLEYLPSKSLSG